MPIIKLPPIFKAESKSHIANLHTALSVLKMDIAPKAVLEKKIEATTMDAIKKIQEEFKLPVDGNLTEKTLAAVNTQLHDKLITSSKHRTAELQFLFGKLKIEINTDEKKKRITGDSTRKAIETFQRKEGLLVDGKLSEEVLAKMHNSVINEKYYSAPKNQRGILHTTLQKVNKIAKLNIEIDAAELKNKDLGASSAKLIKAFQEKYNIPATGVVDKNTLDKMTSVATSKGTFVKKISAPPVTNLKAVTKELRLNTVSPKVAALQKNLAFLGFKISEKEFNTQKLGKTTTTALLSLQKEKGLAITGHYDKATRSVVNKLISTANPAAVPLHRYRIRGSVRNQLWERTNEMVVKIFELILDKESPEHLAAKKIFPNGFFDLPYDAPVNTANGQVKEKFHLVAKLYTVADQNNPIAVQKHINVKQIHWVNFTENKNSDGTIDYNGKYLGESQYEVTGSTLKKAIGNKNIFDIKETADDRQVSQLSLQTGLGTDEIMCHILSQLVAKNIKVPAIITPEVIFAFLAQNLPPDLPGDLLRGTSDWETIAQLVERIASGIAFLEDAIQQQTLDNAVTQNIISQKIKIYRDQVVQTLETVKTDFTLTKPILVGNGNLKAILDTSSIQSADYPAVAKIFVNNKGVNAGFWSELNIQEAQIGANAIADFTISVEIANVSKNHIPTVEFIKANTGAGKRFKQPSDLAKLDHAGIVALINENGKKVPDNMPGNTVEEKVDNFAAAFKSRKEFLYPAVSLVAAAKKINHASLSNIDAVEKFIDDQKEFNIREQNLDKYIKEKQILLDTPTKNSIKLVQRIHKLTTDSTVGATLIDQKLHSSQQLYFMGKDRLMKLMGAKGVDEKQIHRLYESSKMQYMKVIARITDFRKEMYRDTPAAIVNHTYSAEEIQNTLGDIPDLEKLFGSLDYCECDHCKSLYGPAAYLTDMLRFLKQHSAIDNTKTVKDILFERRPDLGNIKLNCVNTNTALPYIDLVCEILENNLIGNKNFIYQTTLSQKELRAIPENIQPTAYTKLAGEDFPMNISFNLWQEEARTYLNYLRVPRYELMETFQNRTNPAAKVPEDIAIAAEYFNLSSKEKDLIITERVAAVDQNKYWGFDTTQAKVPVSAFMKRSKLSYSEVLELLMIRFVNDPIVNKSEIERSIETCNTEKQFINNLTLVKFDLMHRFIRLWRKSSWKMWELDLLLRNSKIGANLIDGDALTKLKLFKQLQEKLKFPVEALLAFYGDINREIRIKPEKLDVIIQPLFNNLFQNISITNPVDIRFNAIGNLNEKLQPVNSLLPFDLLVLDANIKFEVNTDSYTPVPTVLSALAISQSDFDLLMTKTNNRLSLNSLSILLRYIYLARSLKLSIQDFLSLLAITNTADPFSDLQATVTCMESLKHIKSSGLSVLQLDYILNFRPDSPIGLREESIAQLIDGLRRILEDSRNRLNFLNTIINFDADALAPMNNADTLASISPVQNILVASKIDFVGDNVSAEEIKFISEFEKSKLDPPGNVQNKILLITNIKKTQMAATSLLSITVAQKQNQIISQVASSFNLITEQADTLLNKLKISPSPDFLLANLENENLLAKGPLGDYLEINPGNFGEHFKIYTLLHKSSLVVARMKIDKDDLEYFISNSEGVKTINFSALPVVVNAGASQYNEWLNLHHFLNFKSRFPEPENKSVRSILDLAQDLTKTNLQIKTEISALTKWDEEDAAVTNLTAIENGLGIRHTLANPDYTNANTYYRLIKCFEQMRLAGADAITLINWRTIGNDTNVDMVVAQQTRQAVKAKYEQDDWLSKITPLHDDIREKKRKALMEYHIDYSQRTAGNLTFGATNMINPEWENSTSLFKYFLIDVEMSACQLTSRIKQALSSVQFFVQRCFLNMENKYVIVTQDEKEDKSSPNAWSQWRWMKNYRVWEANRKIFFYPENWLEPELRDDKSPFFKDLENELMQNEVTKENVETAFLSYLHKVDEVSHLEVCGLYHQMEDLNPDEAGYETNIVHVIGRTKAMPNIYYYRTYDMNYSKWSAWDKIEVEITGDHLTPVIYNRKLHLFWLQFMEKPMKAKKVPAAQITTEPSDAPEPLKVIEVQLCWTVKKTEGWSSKKMSKQKLIHPWERPNFAYNLKPYYLSKFNELYLDIYLSTTKEFNDTKFYDPHKNHNPWGLVIENGLIYLRESAKNPVYLTKNRFNETFLPWHSSSFVFNGEIKGVELKGLKGKYFLPDAETAADTDSFIYVSTGFGEPGSMIKALQPIEFGPRLRLPGGMHFKNNLLTNNKVHSPNPSALRVLENTTTTTLLTGASNPFELVITQQDLQLNTMTTDHPMFYQDSQRAFFVKPEWEARLNNYGQVISQNRKYRFLPFYHPYTMLFIREFNRDGIDGLLNRRIQTNPQTYPPVNNFNFSNYSPTSSSITDSTAQTDIVDFSFGGSYSIYNWELFLHAPLMVACRLMQNQKFEDAMNWFHYIFNPTNIEGTASPQRYWITKPFYEYNSADYRKQRIESILNNIQLKENFDQLKEWKNNPFKPHVIARYRPVAYQKNIVMKYLDNLISWGDMLFRRDTIESINEASLLYMLAYELLGDRPQKIPAVQHEELTFNELEVKIINPIGNAPIDVLVEDTLLPVTVVPADSGSEPIPKMDMYYFCIPNNDFISKYWDTVEDRLYKIRHCMNIAGIVRQLPLFEPPIDPALLVKAAAAGIDLNSVLNDLAAPTPFYRFRIVVQKAVEFCNEVKMLGEKLLNALEKKDIESLSLIRSQHEIQLLQAVKEIRKKQIDEAEETIASLTKSKDSAEHKKLYYEQIPRMNEWEIGGVASHAIGIGTELAATIVNIFGASISLVPDFDGGAAGVGGSPTVKVKYGGTNFGNAASKTAEVLRGVSAVSHAVGTLLESQGAYSRRDEENKQQADLATMEMDQLQYQINAADIRHSIAEKELENQEMQIENAKAVDEYMKNKYTNEQLYSWMITQISTAYFQSYQLAFDMAKKAEKCFQYELGITDSNIVQFGYWDSLKKGLLSGDKLMNDIRRLEAEYINQNKREFEITKHISLSQFAPLALITLKETGRCVVSVPEWLFDMDFPGHYMRRIKNVSVSIPCIVGPFTSVNCTLSLLRNETRMEATLSGGAYAKVDENDIRFKTMFGAISSIATSHAQNDSGMFELNFNDERYLPFEGAGVISDWEINLPKENNFFDFSSVSDVILHINYTSRNGGGQLTSGANTDVQERIPNQTAKLFSLKHDFSTEWHKFLNPVGTADQELIITLRPEHFPFFIRGKIGDIQIKKMEVFVESKDEAAPAYIANVKVTSAASIDNIAINADANFDAVPHASRNVTASALGNISLKIKTDIPNNDFKSLAPEQIDNIFVLFQLGS